VPRLRHNGSFSLLPQMLDSVSIPPSHRYDVGHGMTRQELFAAMREPFRAEAEKQAMIRRELGWPIDSETIIDALWLGNVTPGHEMSASYYASPLWQQISKEIFLRDRFLCRVCRRDAEVVHHRSYGYEVMAGLDDSKLISLCKACHHQLHFDDVRKTRKSEWEKRLRRLQRRRWWKKFKKNWQFFK